MQILLAFLFLFSSSVTVIAQAPSKTSTYVLGQYNKTLYDYTKRNNLSSYGLGIQTFFNNRTPFKPTIELTGDFIYLDDKVLRTNASGSSVPTITGMVALLGGIAFTPSKIFYISLSGGPAYISERLLPGIKPSIGFYFSKNQKALLKFSYINIFNRYKPTGDDYGSLSFALGLKVF